MIDTGTALQKLKDVARAHGGDPSVLDDPSLLEMAAHEALIEAPGDGFVTRCDAHTIGVAANRLGAGRERKEDDIDHGVGVTLLAKIGSPVSKGDPLAVVRFNDEEKWESQRDNLASAWSIGPDRPDPTDLILERVDRAQF
jgi:pyrimidine-nucleoside phosphorylase